MKVSCDDVEVPGGKTLVDAGMAEAGAPDFGRSEGAAGQRRRAALLPAPPDF